MTFFIINHKGECIDLDDPGVIQSHEPYVPYRYPGCEKCGVTVYALGVRFSWTEDRRYLCDACIADEADQTQSANLQPGKEDIT
jgi:hypothetical protein